MPPPSLTPEKIVLANGTLTNANHTSHPSLFLALKGGMNNFGIVTRFDLSTFPQGPIASALLFNDISQRDAVFKAFSDIAAAPEFDSSTSLVTSLAFNSSTEWTIIHAAIYTEPVTNPPVFADLLAIPNTANATALSVTSLAVLADEPETAPS